MKPSVIRVAHVGPDPNGKGGMAAVMRDLLASPPPGPWRLDSIVTWRGFGTADRFLLFPKALVELAVWCLRPGRRIVHVHSTARGSLYRKSVCVLLVRALRRPVIVQIHSGPPDIEKFAARLDPLRTWLFGKMLGLATRRAAVSIGSAGAMESCFGVGGFGVIPNAAPAVSEAAIAEGSGRMRAGVLYLGGFANPVKGGDLLVEALGGLAGDLPRASFALAGPGDSPAELRSLEERHPNVRWIGWLDEAAKRDALATYPLFVLPSRSEGLPVALLEAMAWERAVVATRVGGVPDVVSDGRDGLIVPPGDPAALAEAIRRLLGDPAECRRLGAGARTRAVSLNEKAVGGHLEALYRELVI